MGEYPHCAHMGTGGQRGGQRAQLCAGLCAGAVQPGFNFDLYFGAFSLRGGQFFQCIHSGRMEHGELQPILDRSRE